MKKLLLLATMFLLMTPSIMADTWGVHFRFDDPGDTELDDPTWGPEFAPGTPVNVVIPPAGSIFMGIHNAHIWVNMKTLTLTLTGPGVHGLSVDWVKGWLGAGKFSGLIVDSVDGTVPNQLVVVVRIFPQPNWEVLKLDNNTGGGITITGFDASSECVFIPTTTTYGLAVFVLLLIGSTVWVLRRKRAGAVA